MSEEIRPNTSNICLSCGLCCDGTLFKIFQLAGDESLPLGEHNLSRIPDVEGLRTYAQPCPAFCAGKCSIYRGKPSICGEYRCQLLLSLEVGEISFHQAFKSVNQTKAARTRVVELMGSAAASARSRQDILADSGEDECPPEGKLAIGILEIMLDRHFRKPGQNKLKGPEEPHAMRASTRPTS